MRYLILALLIVPALEIGVFVAVGRSIGPWWVIFLIIFTGVIGLALAKYQGMETWKRAERAASKGQVPAEQIVDGICIFIGAVLLFAPGILTDIVGFLLVIPWTRKPFKYFIYYKIQSFIARKSQRTIYWRK
ncbi:MAG TPA: FxsA family protein [Bacillota bacterium]|nr:FxsA family protein [Bacillota bacterium]